MFEEAIVYALMIAIAAPAVVVDLIRDQRFTGEPTLCLAMLVVGVAGMARLAARRTALPRARARA